MPDRRLFDSILITGASSGIGSSLARRYARPGCRTRADRARSDRLAVVAADCRAAGAVALELPADVTDQAALADAVAAAEAARPLDLVIANAGISAGTGGAGGESPDQLRRITRINVDGVINTVTRRCRCCCGAAADRSG